MPDHTLVSLEQDSKRHDLSLPKHLVLSKLLDKLTQLYGWTTTDQIELKSKQTGQILGKTLSLSQSGVADGDCLLVLDSET